MGRDDARAVKSTTSLEWPIVKAGDGGVTLRVCVGGLKRTGSLWKDGRGEGRLVIRVWETGMRCSGQVVNAGQDELFVLSEGRVV